MDFPKIEGSRYNNWCERKIMVSDSQEKTHRAYKFMARKDLAKTEASALFLHELTSCDGFEFVAFSDTRLEKSLILNNDITIVPCFLVDQDGISMSDPINKKNT